MDANEMIKRTKQFAIDCGHLILLLPSNVINHAYSAQLIKASSQLALTTELQESPNPKRILLISLKSWKKKLMNHFSF